MTKAIRKNIKLKYSKDFIRNSLIFVVIFAILGGTLLLFNSHAAPSYANNEVENGTLANGASVINVSNASGGSAVKFGSIVGNTPGVYVSGNKLVNGKGTVITLHGVNVPSSAWSCAQNLGFFQQPVDQIGVNALLAWHINVVRLAVNEDCWLGINGVPSQYAGLNYINAMVSYINLLNQNGIYVILDLQSVAPGTNLAGGPGSSLPAMADQDHAPAFWNSAAQALKNNHSVIFDLYNEPWPDNNQDSTAAWNCWLNGGTCPNLTYNGIAYQAAGMQELVTNIRNVGATNVLMLGGTNFADKFDQWASIDSSDPSHQLAVSFHTYFGGASCPNGDTPQSVSTDICYDSVFVNGVGATVPIITGELGEGDCADGMVNPYMQWADQHNNVSYLGWAWFAGDCSGFPSLISNYNGTATNFGIGFQQHYTSTFPATGQIQ